MANANPVPRLYQSVVDDVITNVREFFLDDGVDEQVLLELKQLWQSKLLASKVLQHEPPAPPEPVAPPVPIPAAATVTAQPQIVQQQTQPTPQGRKTLTSALPTGQLTQTIQAQQVVNPGMPNVLEHMSGAAQTATLALPPGLYQQQLAALQGTITLNGQQYIIQQPQLVQARPTAPTTSTNPQAAFVGTTQPNTTDAQPMQRVLQLDGKNDSSSDDDDDDDDDAEDKDDDEDDQNDEDGEEGEEEESLNSADDVSSEEDPTEVFDTESVVVCQFDKINRNKNKWKFHLKDGIMNLNGKDYVFQKGLGEADW